MIKYFKYIIFVFIFFISSIVDAQSIVKVVSGKVYETIENKKIRIRNINTIVSDTNLLSFESNSYIIVEANGVINKISKEDESNANGLRLIDFKPNKDNNEDNSFWENVLSYVFTDSFDDKIKVDGLYISQSQTADRGKSNDSLKVSKFLSNYKSIIKLGGGNELKIICKGENILEKENSKQDFIVVDKHVLKICNPCNLLVDGVKGGVIESVQLAKDEERFLNFLFKNLDSGFDNELSQLCIIKLLISNELYMNANYFIDKFSDNKLIDNYLIKMKNGF